MIKAWIWSFVASGIALLASYAVEGQQRVVSQTVGTDEFLTAVADPDQIAALSHLSNDRSFSAIADQATGYPRLRVNGDAEDILQYEPTLVLFADYSRAELVEQVGRTGVQIMIFDQYESLEDAFANLRRLAGELGTESRAEALIEDCETRVAALKERLLGCQPVRVIAPSTYGRLPGAQTTFQDLCDHGGAENLAASLGNLVGHAPPPNEQMLTWPVDVIVLAGDSLDQAIRPYIELSPYSLMEAVQNRRAVVLEPWQLACVSHHRVSAYERLAQSLHPEAFE
jgi:iron complex transport system substrate-binding protein